MLNQLSVAKLYGSPGQGRRFGSNPHYKRIKESPVSQRSAPPNWETRKCWLARRLLLTGGFADPVSRRGAPGVGPDLWRLGLKEQLSIDS